MAMTKHNLTLSTQSQFPVASQSATVTELLEASKRPNTLLAYKSDWLLFRKWCAETDLQALPASAETVAEYIASKVSELRPTSLQRHCASIAQAHRVSNFKSPTESELVRTVLQGVRAQAGLTRQVKREGRKVKAPALNSEDMRKVIAGLPNDGAGLRDLALLLVGYKAALRRNELAALQWWQVESKPEGILLNLANSKTDSTYSGQQVALVREGGIYCPVEALSAWREWCINSAGMSATDLEAGAVFRSINKHSHIGTSLCSHSVGEIVKARTAGVGLEGVTAHSLRRGHITEGHLQGKQEADLMKTSRHKSVAVFRTYIDEADPFARATGKGLL